jgi:hypothetical protein
MSKTPASIRPVETIPGMGRRIKENDRGMNLSMI